MTESEYTAYLASDWWQARRKRAFYLACRRCQSPCCGLSYLRSLTDQEVAEQMGPVAYRLEVHHLTYARLGNEADDDLIVLCPECHATAHGLDYVQPSQQPWTKSIGEALGRSLETLAIAFEGTPTS